MTQSTIGLRTLRKTPLKTARLHLRITEDELIRIAKAAELENLPPAEYARRTLAIAAEAVLAAAQKPKAKKKS